MSSIVVQVRVESELKDEAQAIYEKLGLDLPSAIRMFLKKSILERGLPFRANLDDGLVKKQSLECGRQAFYVARQYLAEKNVSEMPVEEIEAEIKTREKGR